MFVLVDGDAVGVDLHREAGEGAGVFHFAHAEDRDRLQQRAHAGADDLVADLRRVLPREDGFESGGAAFGEHLRDRRGEHVVGLVDQQRHAPGLVVGLVVAGLEGAVQELQQQLADEHGVVLADGGLGAGEDEHLAAFEDAFEVERDGVAQERVDLAGGDQAFELVARRVERGGGEAAVGDQGGELAAPVVAREVVAGDLREPAGDALAVGRVAGLEQAVDVPQRRRALDRADGCDGLAQEGVRGGLDRAGRVGLDQRVEEDGGAGARAGVDRRAG